MKNFLRLTLDQLPQTPRFTGHGIRLPNAADGVPGLTQDPVKTGGKFVYEFTAHGSGHLLLSPPRRGPTRPRAVRPMIIDDPGDPGGYGAEWILVLRRLDRWHPSATPDEVFKKLIADGGPASGGGVGGPRLDGWDVDGDRTVG